LIAVESRLDRFGVPIGILDKEITLQGESSSHRKAWINGL